MTHNLDMGPRSLGAESDDAFVTQLRHMAASTPVIALPGVANVVRAGRSRAARRRSVFASAFGVALLAGAGLSTMPQLGAVNSQDQATPAAAVMHYESATPLELPVEVGRSPIAPLAQPLDLVGGQGVIPATDTAEPAPESVASRVAEPAGVVETDDLVETDGLVEAAEPSRALGWVPLATGLGIAGTASLATAAGLALRSRKLQPVPFTASRHRI